MFSTKNWNKLVSRILHIPTTVILIGIALTFSILIFKLFFGIVYVYFFENASLNYVLEEIFLIFLYIEVIASIKIYFTENFHFPLRFFLYIAITHLIRQIIINHSSVYDSLMMSLGILILILTLCVYEIKNHYLAKNKAQVEDKQFEL